MLQTAIYFHLHFFLSFSQRTMYQLLHILYYESCKSCPENLTLIFLSQRVVYVCTFTYLVLCMTWLGWSNILLMWLHKVYRLRVVFKWHSTHIKNTSIPTTLFIYHKQNLTISIYNDVTRFKLMVLVRW